MRTRWICSSCSTTKFNPHSSALYMIKDRSKLSKKSDRQRSFRLLSFRHNGLSDLRRQTTVFPTSVARQRSFRPPSSADNDLSDLRRPPTTVLTTSFADYCPFDLRRRRPLNTVLMTSFADYGPSDLRRQTTVSPTSVAYRLRSLRPPLPTAVFPTSVARQQLFRPSSPADYGPYDLLCRLLTFRPPSPSNGFSDLRRSPITVLTTSFADYGPFDLHRQTLTMVLQTSVAR
ncbi:hypothetical protein M5K25_011644 [Dendrobium thyrsiflorum]|uniref:Uncharacterized protein n=1 Tax=Dendrobium thyrsiflorum TaxID=117978 RepID=A0ABD0V3P7_DENTH